MLQMSCPSIIGRTEETAELRAALDRATTGVGGTVWVTGEAGIGKSRLVTELCEGASGTGIPVLSGRAVDTGTPVPFRPLFEALSGHIRRAGAGGGGSLDRRALAPIVPEWRVAGEETYQASPMEIGEALLRFLISVADDACVLVLEDLHWSDPDTAAVVEYLADNLATTPVLCIVTSRPEGSGPADRMLRDLAARGSATRVELGRLTRDELTTMASICLDSEQLDAGVTSLIDHFADGLPFLVEELLTTSVADGTIAASTDGWRILTGSGPSVPERFAELVGRRMSSLDAGTVRALRVAAVLGQRFDVELLRAALAEPISAVADALREGVGAQVLISDQSQPTTFEFRHALTRDAILDELIPLERMEIARDTLAALDLDRADLGDPLWEQAATLAETAGDARRAAQLLLHAANNARQRGALSSAVPMLQRAWSFVDERDSEWSEIGAVLLSALATTGEIDEALAVGDRLRSAAAPDRRADIHLAMARAAAEASRWDTAREHADAARHLAEYAPGSLVAARLDAVRAEIAVGLGHFHDAAALAETVLAIAEQLEDHQLRAAASLVIGRCERGRGIGDPCATFDRVIQIGREHGLPTMQIRGLMERSSLALWNFEPSQAIVTAREQALNAGALVVVAHIDNFLAISARDHHHIDQVEPAAHRCIDLAARLRLPALQGVATVALAIGAAYRGDKEAMERLIVEAEAVSDGAPDVIAYASVPRALYWFDRDDFTRASRALDQVIGHLRQAPALSVPEWGIWALLRALSGSGATEAIDELDERFGPGVVIIDSYRHYAKSVVAGRNGSPEDATRHVALAERVEPTAWFQHNARRLMAETAHTNGWGEPVSWLRDGYAYFDTRGDDRRSTSCRSLLVKIGAAAPRKRRSDERVPPNWRVLGVSAREADVLELLADARSTRSVAELLHISPKTVERHIGNLAGKLGVEGRTGVVAFAARSAGKRSN